MDEPPHQDLPGCRRCLSAGLPGLREGCTGSGKASGHASSAALSSALISLRASFSFRLARHRESIKPQASGGWRQWVQLKGQNGISTSQQG